MNNRQEINITPTLQPIWKTIRLLFANNRLAPLKNQFILLFFSLIFTIYLSLKIPKVIENLLEDVGSKPINDLATDQDAAFEYAFIIALYAMTKLINKAVIESIADNIFTATNVMYIDKLNKFQLCNGRTG